MVNRYDLVRFLKGGSLSSEKSWITTQRERWSGFFFSTFFGFMLCVGLLGNFPHSALSTSNKKGTQLLSLTSPGVTHTFASKDRDNGAVSFNISTVSSVAGSSLEGVIGHLSIQHGNPELENVQVNSLQPPLMCSPPSGGRLWGCPFSKMWSRQCSGWCCQLEARESPEPCR